MTAAKILVKDYMKSVTDFFTPEQPVEEIVKTLVTHHLIGAPVIGQSKELLGFITEQDCLKHILNSSYYCETHVVARDIMRENPLSVSPEDDITGIAEQILAKKPKMYPVVDEGRVIGIITRRDILKALNLNRQSVC